VIDQSVFLTASAFSVLAIVLLLATFTGRLHWGLKASLVAMCLTASGGFYVGMKGLLGWPVAAQPPAEFTLVWAKVEEPSAADPGRIYLWHVPPGEQRPRSIVMPYSRPAHEKLEKGKRGVTAGDMVNMKADKSAQGAPGTTAGELILDFAPPPRELPMK
jgi:hypothetical protein